MLRKFLEPKSWSLSDWMRRGQIRTFTWLFLLSPTLRMSLPTKQYQIWRASNDLILCSVLIAYLNDACNTEPDSWVTCGFYVKEASTLVYISYSMLSTPSTLPVRSAPPLYYGEWLVWYSVGNHYVPLSQSRTASDIPFPLPSCTLKTVSIHEVTGCFLSTNLCLCSLLMLPKDCSSFASTRLNSTTYVSLPCENTCEYLIPHQA